MLTLLSLLVASACALASLCRLSMVIAPTALDPRLLADALDPGRGLTWGALRDAVAGQEGLAWERDLFAALAEPDRAVRAALVSEQITELEGRADRWARAPRVCASIATSSGFLLGCIALLHALSASSAEPHAEGLAGPALMSALNALAIGLAGASFCAAAHVRARSALRDKRAAIVRLVQRLDALARSAPTAAG